MKGIGYLAMLLGVLALALGSTGCTAPGVHGAWFPGARLFAPR